MPRSRPGRFRDERPLVKVSISQPVRAREGFMRRVRDKAKDTEGSKQLHLSLKKRPGG